MNQIFGAIGFTGAAVAMTVLLIVGTRRKWKIKFSDEGVIICAFITGQFYAQAGETFAFVADVSGGLSEAIRQSFGAAGGFGAGAVALVFCLVLYGCEPKRFRNAVIALMLPSLFTAAGGIFAIITTVLSNLTRTVAS